MLKNDISWGNSEQDCDHEALLSSITAGMTCVDSTKSSMNKCIARGTIMAFSTESEAERAIQPLLVFGRFGSEG